MNTRRLETFLAIVRHGSFAAAADHLCATTSALSLRIVQLEAELGVRLFDRSKRKVHLTDRGRLLVGHAEAILSAMAVMKKDVADEASVPVTVRLGIAELIAVTWLPQLVSCSKELFPNLQLEIKVNIGGKVIESFFGGQFDIIMVPGVPHHPNLEVFPLGTVDFRWFAAAGAMFERDFVPGSPDSPPILLLQKESFIYDLAQAFFTRHRVSPSRVDHCNSMSVLGGLTTSGLGVSLLPLHYYKDAVANGELQLLATDVAGLSGEFEAVLMSHKATPIVRRIAQMAGELSTFGKRSLMFAPVSSTSPRSSRKGSARRPSTPALGSPQQAMGDQRSGH